MPGIPPDLAHRLRETLNRCGPFDSDHSLRAVFTAARIYPWRDAISDNTPNRAARVDALIDALSDQTGDEGDNALFLFLRILADRTSSGDSCHQALVNLAAELHRALREELGTSSPVSAAAASSSESKYTIHIHGGQVGFIGDQAQVEGGIRFGSVQAPQGTAEAAPHDSTAAALRMARRALAILEEQAAGYTALTIPTHLKIELEENRREVAEMEMRAGKRKGPSTGPPAN